MPEGTVDSKAHPASITGTSHGGWSEYRVSGRQLGTFNDPSAGSPTETLLRLLLPLNDQVCSTSQQRAAVAGSPPPIRGPH